MESASKLEVISVILRGSSRGYGLYQLRSRLEGNLTPSEINKYLIEMMHCGLICPTRGGFNYDMTPKGIHFLKLYNELLRETPAGYFRNYSNISSLFSVFSVFVSKCLSRFVRG